MSYGDGSLWEVKKKNGASYSPKRWRIRLCFTYDVTLPDGTTETVTEKINDKYRGTKTDAEAYKKSLIENFDPKGRLKPEILKEAEAAKEADELTLSKMVEMYLSAVKTAGTTTKKTYDGYKADLKKVEDHIGSVPLRDITAQMIEATYAKIKEERNLSGTSMNHIHVVLKSVFKKARSYELIDRNPFDNVIAPKRDKPERRFLSEERAATLQDKVDADELAEYEYVNAKEERRAWREEHGCAKPRNAFRGLFNLSCIIAVRIGLATGMRKGEVLGLVWERVSFDKGCIMINCATDDHKGYKLTKSDTGMRTIALDPETIKHLSKWKQYQADSLKTIGVKQIGSTPVICSNVGSVMEKRNFYTWWENWRVKSGFPDLKFHELRHTQATLLLSNGVDVKTAADRLGHDPAVLLKWYAHAIPAKDTEAANMIGGILSRKGKEDTADEQQDFSDSNELPQDCPIFEVHAVA